MKTYSSLFKTLHDEIQPIGNLGRGTHYSILRAVVWHDENFKPLNKAHYLDFAVIWDEDHDERVIQMLEQLYINGLLFSAIMVGERKGLFHYLLSKDLFNKWSVTKKKNLFDKVEEINIKSEKLIGDYFNVYVSSIEDEENGIINDCENAVKLYLNAIAMLWDLGIKEIPVVYKYNDKGERI